MAFNAAILLVLSAGSAIAQYPIRPNYPPPGGPQQPPPATTAPGSAGQVMYFCKPADAAVPISGSGAGVVGASGAADLPTAPPQPPNAAAANQTVNGGAAALPIPPLTPAPAWASPGQIYTGGAPALPSPLPPAQAWTPPNQYSVPDPSNPVQPRMAYVPTNQPVSTPQPAANPMGIPQVNMQPGAMPPERKQMIPPDPRSLAPEYRTTLPPREEIFRIRSPEALENWVLEGTRESLNIKPGDTSLKFPDEERIGGLAKYQAKTNQYPPQQVTYQNLFVVHRRLHFEELNAERYGWDFGILQPLVSTAYFYKDVLLLPYSLASGFNEGFWDSNSGKCLPGSPTPYMLYPPGLSITGGAFEGAVVVGLAAFIP